MFKRLSCFILCFTALLLCFTVYSGSEAKAADDTMEKLYSLVRQFPDDKYWNHMGNRVNNPDGYTDTPCAAHRSCGYYPGSCYCNSFDNAIQCMGYAYKIAYEITGVSARLFTKVKTLSASKLRVGDVIRYNGHSICVTGVKGTTISFTDNNFTGLCQIRWSQMDISKIKNFNYVLHLDGNNRKNTDIDFYLEVPKEEPVTEKREIWKMSENNLNVRRETLTDAKIVGKVNAGTQFYVYEKKIVGKYLWAKVKSGSTEGWAVLNYATYVKGEYETPEIIDPKESYSTEKITFKWNKVSGASEYKIRLYNEKKKALKTYTLSGNKKTLTVPGEGTYYVKIFAINGMCPTWKPQSEPIKFKMSKEKKIAAPKNLKQVSADTNTSKIKLTWSKVAQADGYRVYLYNTEKKNYSLLTSTKNTSYTAKELSAGKNYKFVVRSYFKIDGERIMSPYATLEASTDPAKVKNAEQSSSSSGTVTISWSKVKNADVYVVYKYDKKTKKNTKIKSTAETKMKLTQKEASTAYYRVRAVTRTASGNIYGSYSEICTTTAGPVKPTVHIESLKKNQAKITWNKVPGATHYFVYRLENGKYKRIKTLKSDTFSFTDKKLVSGKKYSYKVKAATLKNGVRGNGTASAAVKVAVK